MTVCYKETNGSAIDAMVIDKFRNDARKGGMPLSNLKAAICNHFCFGE